MFHVGGNVLPRNVTGLNVHEPTQTKVGKEPFKHQLHDLLKGFENLSSSGNLTGTQTVLQTETECGIPGNISGSKAQEPLCEFEASLVNRTSSRTAVTQRNSVLKKNTNKQTTTKRVRSQKGSELNVGSCFPSMRT